MLDRPKGVTNPIEYKDPVRKVCHAFDLAIYFLLKELAIDMKTQRKNVDNDSKIVYAATTKQLLKNAMSFCRMPARMRPLLMLLNVIICPFKILNKKWAVFRS